MIFIKKYPITLLAFLIIAGGLFYRTYVMRDVTFHDWDEGIYATVSEELLQNPSLETTFNETVWLNKPPFLYALFALSFALPLQPEVAARGLIAIMSIALLGATYLLGKSLMEFFFNKRLQGMKPWEKELALLLPVFALAATNIFLERSTLLNTDVLLGLAWLLYFLAYEKGSYIGRVLSTTLGTWTKSFVGLYPIGFEVLYLRKKHVSLKSIAKGIVLIIVALSWHIYSYLKYGDFFIKAHVIDQVVRRVTEPLELKEASRIYYAVMSMNEFNILLIFIILGYCVAMYHILRPRESFGIAHFIQQAKKLFNTRNWFYYSVLFSALPFLVFLTFTTSKIPWYFMSVAPLMVFPLQYFYFSQKNVVLRNVLMAIVVVFFAYRFFPMTYGFTLDTYTKPDITRVAECISVLPFDDVSFYANDDERRTHHIIEASNTQTVTTFLYGGNPSFVYYSKKHVNFFYSSEEFEKHIPETNIVLISKWDISDEDIVPAMATISNEFQQETQCYFGEWEVFSRR